MTSDVLNITKPTLNLGKRVAYLDGIRILSSIVVCIAHGVQIFLMPKLGKDHSLVICSGYAASYAVVTFFILSGYMVTNSIFNNTERNGDFHFLKYCKDRLLRLYPPLVFSIILSACVYKCISVFNMHGALSFRLPGDLDLARESVKYSWDEIFNSLLFIQGFKDVSMNMNGPLWSLGDEFVLYIIAALISVLLLNHKRILPIVLLIACLGFVYKTGHLVNSITLYFMWFFGAFLSIAERSRHVLPQSQFGQIISALVLFTCLGLIFYFFGTFRVSYAVSPFGILQCISFISLVLLFKSIKTIWRDQIKHTFEKITPAKDYTYTLYVIHFPILLFCFSLLHGWLSKEVLYITVVILLILLPIIILLARGLARHLEKKTNAIKVFEFIKNN
jgi:peptidoglycan/LPS O-acetylase OafA/YrhL